MLKRKGEKGMRKNGRLKEWMGVEWRERIKGGRGEGYEGGEGDTNIGLCVFFIWHVVFCC